MNDDKLKVKTMQIQLSILLVSEWIRFNIPHDKLWVISEMVLQAITCTGTDNKN